MDFKTKNKIRDLSTKITSLKVYLFISTSISFILFILCIILSEKYMYKSNEVIEICNNYSDMETDYNILLDKYNKFNNNINELITISETLETQANDYNNELEKFKTREELYDKYEYALFSDGDRTDITYDQLVTLESLIKESNIGDVDLILSIVMTESRGKELAANPTSTAKGYGQFLNSTSKFTYTKLLGNPDSEWNEKVALDGATNLEMMVAYTDYLYEYHNRDLYKVIKSYRGKEDISDYVSKIDSYLVTKNKSVESISKSLDKSSD